MIQINVFFVLFFVLQVNPFHFALDIFNTGFPYSHFTEKMLIRKAVLASPLTKIKCVLSTQAKLLRHKCKSLVAFKKTRMHKNGLISSLNL